jgi:hypothetical protein
MQMPSDFSAPALAQPPSLESRKSASPVWRALQCLTLLVCLTASLSPLWAGPSQYRAVTLSWDPNPEPDIAGYKLHYGTASGAYDQVLDVGDVTHASLLTLLHGTDYFFTVNAYNSAGLEGPLSDEAVVLSDNANLSSLALSTGTLTPPFDSSVETYSTTVSDVTDNLALLPAPEDAAATVTVNGVPVPPGGSAPVIPLTVGDNVITTVVTAKNGKTKRTNTVTVTRPASAPGAFVLASQTPVWANAPSPGPAVQLNWTKSSGASGYDLYRDGAICASDLSATSLTDNTGLLTGKTYNYYVIAKNATGTRQSNTLQVGPMPDAPVSPPGAFTLQAAMPPSGGASGRLSVALTWTPSSAATGYDVYRNSALYAANISAGQLSLVNNTNLAAKQTYTYYVVARNAGGSRRSNTISLTVPGAPKAASRVTSPDTGVTLTSSTATFRWDAGSGVSQRTLWVGTAPGTGPEARNLYASNERGYSRTVAGLPRDGRSVYVTLRSLVNGGWQSNVYVYTAFTGPKVLVLLHDSNASPAAASPGGWDPLLAALQFPNSPIIYNGKTTAKASASPQGVFSYRVRFGRKDALSLRKGLEGISASSGNPPPTAFPGFYSGDFEQLADLGAEVADAVSCVLSRHADAQIVLLAHGRGGLAARAFLQSPKSSASAKRAVVALQTVGTAHSGTPVARFYAYLTSHPRLTPEHTANAAEADNWAAIDTLSENIDQGMDLRRPATADLIPGGSVLTILNRALGELPNIAYVSQIYAGTDLGWFIRNLNQTPANYGLFQGTADDVVPAKAMSRQAAEYVLGPGKNPSDYQGDGFVPATSQAFPTQGLPPGVYPKAYTYSKDVYHAEETAQTSDIISILGQTVAWWP